MKTIKIPKELKKRFIEAEYYEGYNTEFKAVLVKDVHKLLKKQLRQTAQDIFKTIARGRKNGCTWLVIMQQLLQEYSIEGKA